MSVSLLKKEVKDEYSKENFRRIENTFNADPLRKGNFKFYERSFSTTGSYPYTFDYVHNLGFEPKDVILTSVIGGDIDFNYVDFTPTTVNITISAALTARFFLGRYEEMV